jgi:hypothetical protein
MLLFRVDEGEGDSNHTPKRNNNTSKDFLNQTPKDIEVCMKQCLDDCSLKSKLETIGLNCMTPCIQKCSFETSSSENRTEDFIHTAEILKNLPQNFCLNGKADADPYSKAYLLEFAKGPCSPLMLVPGVTATKLVISIDCEVFKANEPKVFDQCGWNACSKSPFEFWKSVPDQEYDLWIPGLLSPMSIFSVSDKSNFCFASLVKPHYKLDKPVTEMFEPRKGIRISISGFTPNTSDLSACGKKAVTNILPLTIQTKASKGFLILMQALEYIGYVSGLTVQAMPYNFYYTYRRNEFGLNFIPNLDRLIKNTGKKVTIIAHSMGNLNVLHNIKQMTKQEKEDKIFNYVVMAAPFLGVIGEQRGLVAPFDGFSYFNGKFGFHAKPAAWQTPNQSTNYEMLAVDPFKIYEGQPWFENVKKRIAYENSSSDIPYSESGIPFWPPKNETCHESKAHIVDTNCKINIYNTTSKPILKIGESEYFIHDTQKLLESCNLTYNTPNLYNKLIDEEFTIMNPEIPIILIFGSSIQSSSYSEFDDNIRQTIDNDQFPHPKKVDFIPGDGSVAAYSTLLPVLKWALEFESKENPDINYKPTKIVEFCGTGFTGIPVYDKKENGLPFEITKNQYIGLNCECNNNSDPDFEECVHSVMQGDAHLVEFLTEVAISNQQASEEALNYINTLTDEGIKNDVEKCAHIKPTIFE